MSGRLTIFDCDGVLVDSEVLVIGVEAQLLSEAGFPITAGEIAERFVGLSYTDMMTQLASDYGRPVPEALSSRIQEDALAVFRDRLLPVEGMPELLEDHRGPRCVASSSKLDRLRLSLDVTEMSSHFEPHHVFSSEMVTNGKPAPDLFLHAAASMDVEAAACVVIEDSPHGVAAAIAADMQVVGFTGGGHAGPALERRLRAAGAHAVASTADELAAHLP